jgi:hypothetical protein
MYLRFKEAFEPFSRPRYVVDNTRELFPQVQEIIENLGLDSTTLP